MHQTIFFSCLVFLFFLLLLPHTSMLEDPDTFWHLATGDLIRESGSIPAVDPWSFTAGDYRWLSMSWGWDIVISAVFQHGGWGGIVAFNSVILATTIACVFAACFVRCGHGIAAFIVTLLMVVMTLNVSARPHQVSYLFTSVMALLLFLVAGKRCSRGWLLLAPVIVMVWANVHGGFIAGLFLLGIHGLAAIRNKDRGLVLWLLATGIASLLACLVNPYGIAIAEATWRILFCVANPIISEWSPLSLSLPHLYYDAYIALFLMLVTLRRLPAADSEKWSAYAWLLLGISSVRHICIFAIVSAPLLATGLRDVLMGGNKAQEMRPMLQKYYIQAMAATRHRAASGVMFISVMAVSGWMFTGSAMREYHTQSLVPPPDLSGEIAFIETHYPKARLMTPFNLGGPLIFYTRGKIPVFADGRTEGAYPKQVLLDYMAFFSPGNDWQGIVDRYRLDGVLAMADDRIIRDRFSQRKGWHLAFEGKTAVLYMRQKP